MLRFCLSLFSEVDNKIFFKPTSKYFLSLQDISCILLNFCNLDFKINSFPLSANTAQKETCLNIHYENVITNRISQTTSGVRLLLSFWVHCFHYQKLKKILHKTIIFQNTFTECWNHHLRCEIPIHLTKNACHSYSFFSKYLNTPKRKRPGLWD